MTGERSPNKSLERARMDKVQRLRWLLASLVTARWRPESRRLAAQLGR